MEDTRILKLPGVSKLEEVTLRVPTDFTHKVIFRNITKGKRTFHPGDSAKYRPSKDGKSWIEVK